MKCVLNIAERRKAADTIGGIQLSTANLLCIVISFNNAQPPTKSRRLLSLSVAVIQATTS